MTLQEIVQGYIDKGYAVVPIGKGEKKAHSSWPKKTYKAKDFNDGDNIAFKCGKPSGGLIDFDCDCLEAVEVARLLMPKTGLVHGRAGKPDSHYWFKSNQEMKTTQFTDIKDSAGKSRMLLEIRSTGGYTVVPPGIWTDKQGNNPEDITWSIEREPTAIDADIAYDVGAQLAFATLLAVHWPGSGARHAAIGPMVGMLCQAGVDPAQAVRVVMAAATAARDSDLPDREKFARMTAGKFAAGDNVTGAPALVEYVGEAVVQRLRAWLRVADLDAIDAMNAKHFWVRLGKDDCIGREDSAQGTIFQRVRSLYSEYANVKVQTGVDKDGAPTFKPIFPEWLEHQTRRTYREVTFSPPPRPADPRDYNLWTGYALSPAQHDDLDKAAAACVRFREHCFEVICSGNDEHFNYLEKLCAYTIQAPGYASEVATVLRGMPGTGKGTFVRAFKRIFGRHFAHLDRVEDLVNFNALISGKVIVFADEAFWAGDKREIGALKRIITEPTLRITRKGIDSVEEPNCMHLFMATNDEWSVPAQLRERRFLALKVSNAHIQDLPYFEAIEQEMQNGGNEAWMQFMLGQPVTKQEILNVPKTQELRVQQDQSLPLELRWWQEVLWEERMGSVNPWDSWVPCARVYDEYALWMQGKQGARTLDKLEFGRRLMVRFISGQKPMAKRINGNTERCVKFRTLSESRKVFDDECGVETEWPSALSASSQSTIPF